MNTLGTVTSGINACVGQTFSFAGRHVDKVFFTWGVTQVALTHLQSQDSRQMERIFSYKNAFFGTGLVGASYSVIKFTGALLELLPQEKTRKYLENFNKNAYGNQMVGQAFLLMGCLSVMGIATGAYYLASKINERCKSSPDLLTGWYKKYDETATNEVVAQKEKELLIEWGVPDFQNRILALFLVSIIANSGIAIFGKKQREFYGSLAVLQITAMVSVVKWRWIKISSPEWMFNERETEEHPMGFRYQFFFSIFQSRVKESDCTICIDKGADTYFCSNHTYHLLCLIGVMHEASKRPPASLIYKKNVIEKNVKVSPFGGCEYRGDEVQYAVEVKRDDLPRCPECRGVPKQNNLSVEFLDVHKDRKDRVSQEWITATVRYDGEKPTRWEKAKPWLVWLRRITVGI